jgi:hypothetical protein
MAPIRRGMMLTPYRRRGVGEVIATQRAGKAAGGPTSAQPDRLLNTVESSSLYTPPSSTSRYEVRSTDTEPSVK